MSNLRDLEVLSIRSIPAVVARTGRVLFTLLPLAALLPLDRMRGGSVLLLLCGICVPIQVTVRRRGCIGMSKRPTKKKLKILTRSRSLYIAGTDLRDRMF